VSSKGKQKNKMTQENLVIIEEEPKIKLLENAFFAEFSLGLYIHHWGLHKTLPLLYNLFKDYKGNDDEVKDILSLFVMAKRS